MAGKSLYGVEGSLPHVQLSISLLMNCFEKNGFYFLLFQQLSLKLMPQYREREGDPCKMVWHFKLYVNWPFSRDRGNQIYVTSFMMALGFTLPWKRQRLHLFWLQWESKYRTCPVFKWWYKSRTPNVLVFKWHLNTRHMAGFQMIGLLSRLS